MASTPASVADCAARAIPADTIAKIDPNHTYSLAELIDLAERNNPRTRIVWERARQSAERLGLEKSEYYPLLAAAATFADQRTISPFPKPLAPRGYTLAEIPLTEPEVTLNYLLFDFGGRAARVDSARAEKLAAGANFIAANQQVAFSVASNYYKLLTAQERLVATKDTLKTAQTTQDAAENQLANGRSTMPDVLNARAETAQAVFDMESADGDEKIARVQLSEVVGAEPSPFITIDAQKDSPLPASLSLSIEELIDRAIKDRPDLAAEVADIRAAEDAVRNAKAAYRPKIELSGSAGYLSIFPSTDYGQLGNASAVVWSGALGIEWRVFDGGARKNNLLIAKSREREAKDSLRETKDKAVREVWTAYIAFHTAQRQHDASIALLDSANSSYSASLEAYQYGVKNLVDVVTAERQLAQARLSGVTARSRLLLEAVDLEFVTGNLLRSLPPAAKLQSLDTVKPKDGTLKQEDGQKP
ncbi:Cobalt-zinc-cadmium resistance protein CzcA [Granulicella sibirica]|uniref:Cobalt-zinc-cadmium resistance protein CzcA n=1 Tax=Granulicella sibirica TaxID=2479048 RepID=A0A4Q0T3X6_9BACT|nr:Cobalt-zinc-cadmium resistance protein CzcA [Granulicella sibirica]